MKKMLVDGGTGPPTPEPDKTLLVTAPDAAALCGLGRSTWWRLTAGGKTPAPVRIGRAVRWRRDELLAWIEADCPIRSRWEQLRPARRYMRQRTP